MGKSAEDLSASLSLKEIYRLIPLSADSISFDSPFKQYIIQGETVRHASGLNSTSFGKKMNNTE
jgi:hypothetical protein